MRNSLRVVTIVTQMEAAGAQKALLTLARGLKDCGHNVTVVTMYDKGDYVSIFSERYRLDIVNLDMKRTGKSSLLRKAGAALKGLYRLYRLMRQERFDVVQTFSHYSNAIGPVIAWLAGRAESED